jgi:hypothetical protein
MSSTPATLARQNRRFSLDAFADLIRTRRDPRPRPFTATSPVDRDRERLVAELQALPDAPADVQERLQRWS